MQNPKPKLLDWRWWLGLGSPETVLPPPRMSIAAIVPAFNEAKHIAATLEALLRQTYKLDQIIVVDDCSSDNTGDIARTFPGVTVLRTPQNKGTKSQAQNYALDEVTCELFVTIDADTILAPDALYEAMRFFNDSGAEVVCGNVVPQVRETFWERGRLAEYLYGQSIMKPAQNHHGLVLVASGCFSIFRTETVRRLGGFDERTMAEDMDLTWVIHEEGGRVYFASRAICYPVDPPNRQVYVRQMDRWYRGFLQNVKVRRFRIFSKKRSMAFMVYTYMAAMLLSVLFLPVTLLAFVGNVWAALGLYFTVYAVFVLVPVLIQAIRLGVWKEAVLGVGALMVIQYVNLYVYGRAIYYELILGKTLNSWAKGH